eukprot:Sspe_Gene.36261::Locus_17547_Transcript_1_1_Confidence_1.000_Length_2874::g.36261::m.36261
MMTGGKNAVVLLGCFFLLKAIDFEDPDNLATLRLTYGTVQTVCLLSLVWIYLQVTRKNDTTQVKVYEAQSFGQIDDTPFQVIRTVAEYHEEQLKSLALKLIMGAVICLGIHYKWGIVPPLFMQCIVNPLQLWASPLFRIHVLGHPDSKYPVPWEKPKDGLPSLPWRLDHIRDAKKQEKDFRALQKQNKKALAAADKQQ